MSVLSRLEIESFLKEGCFFSSPRGEAWLRVAWGSALRQAQWESVEASQGLKSKFFNAESVAIYAPDFFLEDPMPWWVFPNLIEVKKSDLVQALSTLLDSGELEQAGREEGELSWQGPSKTDFQENFADLQTRFERGELQKAVPVVFEKALGFFSVVKRASGLKNLLMQVNSPHLHLYGLWSAQEGILGATPELLFELNSQNTHLKTLALAGTRLKTFSEHLRTKDASGSREMQSAVGFLEDPKERKEHQWVVDGISASLNQLVQATALTRAADPVLEVGVTQVLELPTLWHLLTPISLTWQERCQEVSQEPTHFFMKVIQALHPTAALGAVPRCAGMRWLRAQDQKFSRRRFGAPWGVVMPDGSSRCWVAIRNLQWDLEKIWFSAGCGVIADSRCEHEWVELQGKLHTVKKYFGEKYFGSKSR